MRVVVATCPRGRVSVDGQTIAEIGPGVVILLGIGPQDGEEQARYLVEKIANLRIFEDEQGKINRSLLEVGGAAHRRLAVHPVRRHAQRAPPILYRRRPAGARPPAGGALCRAARRTRVCPPRPASSARTCWSRSTTMVR